MRRGQPRAWASTRSATRSAASGRPRASGGGRPWRPGGRGRSSRGCELALEAVAVELGVGHQDGRAGRRGHRRWPSGGPRWRSGSGTRTAGRPTAASSATVVPPARPTTRSAAASSRSMWSSYATQLVERGRRPGQLRGLGGRWRRPVAGADDVVDGEVGPVGPAGHRGRRTAWLMRAGPERAAEHGDHDPVEPAGPARSAAGVRSAAPVDGQDLGPHRVAGDDRPRQVGALERHRRGLGEAADQPVGGAGHGRSARPPRSARATARRRARRPRWRSRRGPPRRPGRRRRTRPMPRPMACNEAPRRRPTLARVRRRWMPRPGRTVRAKPAVGHERGLEPALAARRSGSSPGRDPGRPERGRRRGPGSTWPAVPPPAISAQVARARRVTGTPAPCLPGDVEEQPGGRPW